MTLLISMESFNHFLSSGSVDSCPGQVCSPFVHRCCRGAQALIALLKPVEMPVIALVAHLNLVEVLNLVGLLKLITLPKSVKVPFVALFAQIILVEAL